MHTITPAPALQIAHCHQHLATAPCRGLKRHQHAPNLKLPDTSGSNPAAASCNSTNTQAPKRTGHKHLAGTLQRHKHLAKHLTATHPSAAPAPKLLCAHRQLFIYLGKHVLHHHLLKWDIQLRVTLYGRKRHVERT